MAAWDCTFSPVKSVSLLWAAGDERVQRQIWAAQTAAVDRPETSPLADATYDYDPAGDQVPVEGRRPAHQHLPPRRDHPAVRLRPLGRRIASIDGTDQTWYGWDGLNISAELATDGTVTERHVTGTAPGSVLATIDAAGNVTWPLVDGLGTVVAVADTTGNVTDRFAWGLYGNPTGITGDQTYGFTGHTWDQGASLHQARARWYDPAIGRFLSEDPLPALNPHAYVNGDPANLVDPTGMAAATEYGTLTSRRKAIAVEVGKELGSEICSGLIEAAILGHGQSVNVRGQTGEGYVADILGIDKNTTVMPTPGSGPNRIPDFVDGKKLYEVKNVKQLSYTKQLKAFVNLAGEGNLTLFTRAGTRLSRPLVDAIRKGSIKLVPCLPGF